MNADQAEHKAEAPKFPPRAPVTRGGRPRRYEEADELQLLFGAALGVMERNGYHEASVADILSEAGLSTRSFYRHFDSKDQLLCAIYRREAERAAERLSAVVDEAPNPRLALFGWIEEIMSFGYQHKKAARAALLGSASAMRAEGYEEEARHAAKLLSRPLEALLVAGKHDGTFPLADPVTDAPVMQSLAWTAAGLSPQRQIAGSRAEAFDAVRSFCLRALGAAPVP